MYAEMNGKKCSNSVLFTLLVWLLSMFCCLTGMFAIGEDSDLPVMMRMVRPYVKVLANLSGADYFKNLDRRITNTAMIPKALRREITLLTYREQLVNFTSFDSVEKVNCYFKNKKAIDQASENCDKAVKALEAWRQGDDKNGSTIVHDTLKQLRRLFDTLPGNMGRDNASDYQFNSETLGMILLHSGTCFEHKVDSVGVDAETYSKENTLFINGYMKFDPADYRKNLIRYIKPFNFSEIRNDKIHDLAIFLLEKDDGSGITFWGEGSRFDLAALYAMFGFNKNGDATNGMFAEIPLVAEKNAFIRCNRLDWVPGDDFNTIIVNLRPQGWCKWNIALKSVNESIFKKLKSVSSLEVSTPAFSQLKIPATVAFGKHAAVNHVFFDKASGIAADTVVDPIISTSQVFKNKKKADKNQKENKAAPKSQSSPVVKQVVQQFMTPEEKAAAAQAKITEGKKLEEYGDYKGAYKLYKQAADLDSDKGRLNCAILLAQKSVTYTDNRGADISFEIARQFASETLKKSQDKTYRGFAYNIIGVLHNIGGNGVEQNVTLAIQSFERGAELGNENAKKNLKELRETLMIRR